MAEALYLQVAEDLRDKIRKGTYAVGKPIPSSRQLEKDYGVSSTVIRGALNLLKAEQLLDGQLGKAVYVRAVPGVRQDSDTRLSAEVASLRDRVSGLEADLAYLYDATGIGRVEDQVQRPARRKRA